MKKRKRQSRRQSTNRHHLMPKSRWGLDNNANILRMWKVVHSALHTLFDNSTPTEQIESLVNINSKVFTKEFTKELFEVLYDNKIEEIYKNWVIKNWVVRPKRFNYWIYKDD